MIRALQQQQEERELALLPGLHPLVVGNVVLMRTATNLLAVDFESGKRLWEVPADDPFDATLNPPPEGRFALQGNLTAGLRLRLWADATYGTLASDGQLVFAVEDLQLPSMPSHARVLLAPGRVTSPPGSPTAYNRLAAYDLRSEGKLRWQLGGDPVQGRLPLAGAFFLGPPLPLLGDLYAIAEIDGEVRLLAIDAASGGLIWQQQLAVVAQGVLHDALRRVTGVSPSYADGVLVCPTSNRSIVAIELTTRSLLWGYSYAEQESQNQRVPNLFGTLRRRNPNPERRWVDSSLIASAGRILATPVDSDRLHCLELHTGRLLWETPRDDKLLVAGVRGGRVFLLGHGGLARWESTTASLPGAGRWRRAPRAPGRVVKGSSATRTTTFRSTAAGSWRSSWHRARPRCSAAPGPARCWGTWSATGGGSCRSGPIGSNRSTNWTGSSARSSAGWRRTATIRGRWPSVARSCGTMAVWMKRPIACAGRWRRPRRSTPDRCCAACCSRGWRQTLRVTATARRRLPG